MINAKIGVARKSGVIHSIVLQTDMGVHLASGSTDAAFNGQLTAPGRVYVTVVGVRGATYELKVDLPGKANDFTVVVQLADNAQTIDFEVT